MYDITLCFITSFVFTYLAIPSIILIAKKKKLLDAPNDRKAHLISTPSLGGVAIFGGMIFSVIMWTPFEVFGDLQYILCGMLILYMVGVKDDIIPMRPRHKFIGQLVAAVITVTMAKVSMNGFYGFLGIGDLPLYISVPLSIMIVLTIINSFNLIDGINGLSGGLTAVICVTFGYWFAVVGRMELAILAFATVGSLAAFLKFNWSPARIFMGDTGSMLCGFICAILALEFIQMHNGATDLGQMRFESIPIVAFGVLIIPIFDTFRVFLRRILKGKSPFFPDKTHLHHLLLDLGLSHVQASMILIFVNIVIIFLLYFLQGIGDLNLFFVLLIICGLMTGILEYLIVRKNSTAGANAIE